MKSACENLEKCYLERRKGDLHLGL